jgi:putative ABC transport system ATP-binding protein
VTLTAAVPGLVATDVTFRRSGRTIVDAVSVSVVPGRLLGVHGPSGSGKTTLVSLLAGVLRASSGSIAFDGEPVSGGHGVALHVGIVLQGYGLLPILTAAENVEVALQARGRPSHEVAADAAAALERMQLTGMGERLVERLSGGQQQRVAIARALAHRPLLLVADEPTSELDEATRDHVLGELRREADRGAAVVIATHDPDVLAACDSALHLVDGRHAGPAGS